MIISLRRLLIVACLIVAINSRVDGRRRFSDSEVIAKIDNYVDGLLKCKNFTGATLAVVRNGSTLMTKGYGFANVRRNERVTPDTKFAIASITKTFTVQLISKLFADKNIDLNTKVKDLWSGFTAWSGYRYNDLNVKDFLAHKTGVPRNDLITILGGKTREGLISVSRLLKPIYSPRVRMHYNNIFYVLAGKVAEEVADTGDNWESLIEDNLFKVIGMNRSGFYDLQENYDGFATPYAVPVGEDGVAGEPTEIPFETWKNVGINGPAGSIISTANDMAKWLMMTLNDGISPNGKRVLQKESIDRLFNPEIIYDDLMPIVLGNRPELNRFTSYGLGYFNGYSRGVPIHHHGGDMTGFHSTHTIIRSIKSGFYFTTNYGSPGFIRDFIDNAIISILLNEEPPISLEEACNSKYSQKNSDPWTYKVENQSKIPNISTLKSAKLINRNATKYAGRYENWAYGVMSIKVTGGSLIQLTAEYGTWGRYNLYSIDTDTFVGVSAPGISSIGGTHTFTFSDEANGKMKKVTVSFEPDAPPVFERNLGPAPPVNHDKCVD